MTLASSTHYHFARNEAPVSNYISKGFQHIPLINAQVFCKLSNMTTRLYVLITSDFGSFLEPEVVCQ